MFFKDDIFENMTWTRAIVLALSILVLTVSMVVVATIGTIASFNALFGSLHTIPLTVTNCLAVFVLWMVLVYRFGIR